MEYKFGFVYYAIIYGVASDGEKYIKAVHEGVSQIHVLKNAHGLINPEKMLV